MDALRRASAPLFYLSGLLLIAVVVLSRRGMISASVQPLVNSIDLPVIFLAMVFAGSTVCVSLSKERTSPFLILAIFVPLAAIFGFFCWLNFATPFPQY